MLIGIRSLLAVGPTSNASNSIKQLIGIPTEGHKVLDIPEFTLPLFNDLKNIFKTQDSSIETASIETVSGVVVAQKIFSCKWPDIAAFSKAV